MILKDTINTPENRKLLAEHLIEQTIKEKGISKDKAVEFVRYLMKKKKDILFTYHGLAWELGSKNLKFFCLFFLSNIFIDGEDKAEIAPIHIELWSEIEAMILNKTHDKQLYVLPRGTGKSSFISLGTAVWCSCYKYRRFTLICSAIGDTAQTFIRSIRMSLQNNERIEESFGVLYDPKKCVDNNEQIELTNRTMIQSISASSTMRGKNYGNVRVELALLDDFQKDDEVATHEQREKKWKRFNDDVNYAIQKGNSTLIAVGTLQHQECFYSRLKDSPVWKHRIEKGVLDDDVDELFNSGLWLEFKNILFDKKNEHRLDDAKEFYFQNKENMQFPLLWQSYWDCLDMALNYYGNPVSFKQEVQGDITNDGQKKFTTIITEPVEKIEAHHFVKTMLCIDPASSSASKKKADYSAFLVGSVADTSIKYVRKGEVLKLEFDDYINHSIKILKEYTDISHIYIEKNLYMGSDISRLKELISKDNDLKHRRFEWINEMQRANKDDKINTIVADVIFGRIIFNEEGVSNEAILQLKEFSGCSTSPHDDFPDIVAEFSNRINIINVIQKVSVIDRSLLGL
jgi:hypothetical protein